MNNRFSHMSWWEFCVWVQGKKLVTDEVSDAEYEANPAAHFLTFDDGSKVMLKSVFEHDWSKITPGAGLSPPEVYVCKS